MAILSKEQFLGSSDLETKTITLPSGGQVVIQAMAASFSAEAQGKALKMITGARGEQSATVDVQIMEELQVLHSLKEPKLDSQAEAKRFLQNNAADARFLLSEIDEISAIDKEAIESANDQFRAGVEEPGDGGAVESDAPAAVNSGPVVSG